MNMAKDAERLCPASLFQLCTFAPVRVCSTFGISSGTRMIISVSSQPSASQMRSRCSKLTRSAMSWYNSLIVAGLIPVLRDRSACVQRSSPSFLDRSILIVCPRSFRNNLSAILRFFSDSEDYYDMRRGNLKNQIRFARL